MGYDGSGGVSVRAGASPSLAGRRAALRQAQRRALVRTARASADPEAPTFACAWVCVGCGQLRWPEAASASPLRRDASEDEPARRQPCSHCDDVGWIDLGHESTAIALRSGEEEDALDRAATRARVAGWSAMGLTVGSFVGVVTVGIGWPLALVALGGALVGGLATVRTRPGLRVAAPTTPLRWSMVLPPKLGAATTLVGEVSDAAEPLRAPLTGRRCVAYEVGLHPTDDDDDDLPGWALLEQRLAPVRLGDDDIDPARTHLSLPRQRLGVLSTVSLDDFARQWLRQRGFSPDGSTLHAYESIVEPGAAATLARSDDGATLTVAASTALTRT